MHEFSELSSTGLLWWINRVALHPRGLALALHYEDEQGEGEPVGWSILMTDDRIWNYTEEDDQIGSKKFEAFLSSLAE